MSLINNELWRRIDFNQLQKVGLIGGGACLCLHGLFKLHQTIPSEIQRFELYQGLKAKTIEKSNSTNIHQEKSIESQGISKGIVSLTEIVLGLACITIGMKKIDYSLLLRDEQQPFQQTRSFIARDYEEKVEIIFGKNLRERLDQSGSHALNFDPSDRRPKLLLLQSDKERLGFAFDPRPNKVYSYGNPIVKYLFQHRGPEAQLKTLDMGYDIRYKVISDAYEVCKEIKTAGSTIQTLIINAHGTSDTIAFSEEVKATQWHPECFTGLHPEAEIILTSCSTGAKENGFAATLAKISQRKVWSPREDLRNLNVMYSPSVPTRPKFVQAETSLRPMFLGRDITCLSLPNGTHTCGCQDIFSKVVDNISHILEAVGL